MRILLAPLWILFVGCDDNNDDEAVNTDTVTDTDSTRPDSAPDTGSGIDDTDTDTDATSEPLNCNGQDPIHVVGGAKFTDLQTALNAADAGAKIVLCQGTYEGPFVAPAPVRLIGIDGADYTFLDGRGMGTTLTLQPTSSMSGISVIGGSAIAGGGVVLTGAGRYEMADCAIMSNTAEEGGGIWAASGAQLSLADTVIENNHANRGGGIYADVGVDVDLSHGFIEANTAEDNGGGVYALADFTLRSGLFQYNVVVSTDDEAGGGALYLPGVASVSESLIQTNQADRGAAIRVDDASLLTLTNVTITGNNAVDPSTADARGGGLYIQGGQVDVTGVSLIESNNADLGGGAFVTGGGVLTGATVTWGNATSGGGVYLQGGTVSTAIIGNNTAEFGGGVVIDDAGTVSASLVAGNEATADGGGVWAGAILADSLGLGVIELASVTLSDNDAVTGAGVAVTGDVLLSLTDGTVVERNAASGTGGGAWVNDTGATLRSDAAGWGVVPDDNSPDDIVAGTTSYTGYEASATFTCASGVCDPAP